MPSLTYTPDEDVRVHGEGAIRLICRAFQSHENGLPEWLKNSADAYARDDASVTKRVILVILGHGQTRARSLIACLDFAGMTSDSIENDFRVWADPEAARRGDARETIQGGHGNGGKCYMTQMFDEHAFLHTVKNGRGCKYGVTAQSIRFGYIPNRSEGRDFPVPDMRRELAAAMRALNCPLESLPVAAKEALAIANGFTLMVGVGPKGYESRIPVRQLLESLQDHPQMIRTLDLCKVYVVVNGRAYNDGLPLSLPSIPPMPGAEEPKIFRIPETLFDPLSEEAVPTGTQPGSNDGTLTLLTSDVSMRYSRKGRHKIVFNTQSGYIGHVGISELDVQSPYRDRIYGTCRLEALDQYKQNDRARLADSPLTRAIERYASEKVQEYAREFEARDRRQYDQQEKNAISKINEALDKWKNRFLNEMMRGVWGPGQEGPPPPPPPLPSGRPERLVLSLTYQLAGLGVAFRPSLRFFDENDRQVRSVPYRWVSDDNNIAMVDEDLRLINTFSYGETTIWAETLDGRLSSNRVPLEVVRVLDISISPRELAIPVGHRQKLEALCKLADQRETSQVYLIWTEGNASIAKVSPSGLIFGFAEGKTEVLAGDDKCLSRNPAAVTVVPGDGRGRGGQRGRGFPLVLVSGSIDLDPDTQEYVNFSPEDPPVWQRPQDVDRNIWWINSAAPLARMYLDVNRGYGYQSREWRMYHLERYIDVIVQIALANSPIEQASLPVNDWIMQWGAKVAEIQMAAASELAEFIHDGSLPEE